MYFEIHVIVAPPFVEKEVLALVKPLGFWGAVINQDTGHEETPGDLILTSRAKTQNSCEQAIRDILDILKEASYKVTRYKIEFCTLDSKLEDSLDLLKEKLCTV